MYIYKCDDMYVNVRVVINAAICIINLYNFKIYSSSYVSYSFTAASASSRNSSIPAPVTAETPQHCKLL